MTHTIELSVLIKGTCLTLSKPWPEAMGIPRAGDWIEIAEGWCDYLVERVSWSHDGHEVTINLAPAEMTPRDVDKLRSEGGWS